MGAPTSQEALPEEVERHLSTCSACGEAFRLHKSVAVAAPVSQRRPPYEAHGGRAGYERRFVGTFTRGGGSHVLREIGGVEPLAAVVSRMGDPIAKAVGEVVLAFCTRGLVREITPVALTVAAQGKVAKPMPFEIIDVLALGSLPQSEAVDAVVEGWV
jgi:hypothetical protein